MGNTVGCAAIRSAESEMKDLTGTDKFLAKLNTQHTYECEWGADSRCNSSQVTGKGGKPTIMLSLHDGLTLDESGAISA